MNSDSSPKRIYLSPPHLTGQELELVREALDSNWVAPLGPMVDAFEQELCRKIGVPYGVALSSGTAALHLALRILVQEQANRSPVRPGAPRSDEVVCSTFTFAASANVIAYERLRPVFLDCDERTWNMDPELLREELAAGAKRGKLPRAVIVVDLYGQCADYEPILAACSEYDVPVIEDAAEALGAVYWGSRGPGGDSPGTAGPLTRSAGSFGAAAAFSFNGNKIITTSGGGFLASHDPALVKQARYLATQAREPVLHYQHLAVGYNYRMSNILAAVGRAQLRALDQRVNARRKNFEFYRQALGDLPGLAFMPEASYGRSTRWLTCLTAGAGNGTGPRENTSAPADSPSAFISKLIRTFTRETIEARPLWKPMHLQPIFRDCRVRGGAVAERLFRDGICLPSGSALTEAELERVCAVVISNLSR